MPYADPKVRKRFLADYYQKHKEERHAQSKAAWITNPEKMKADQNRRYQEHNQARIETRRKYKSVRIEYFKSEMRKWRTENPDRVRQHVAKRNALKRRATINLKSINEFVSSTLSKQNSVCYYCRKIFPSNSIHFDHIIPLSKGGPHSIENLCVACRDCNLAKHAKFISAWVRVGQQVLSL